MVELPGFKVDQAKFGMGAGLWYDTCFVWHGVELMAGGAAPDLRRSALLKDAAAWQKVVMDGVLAPNGMISFAPYLKPEESEGVRAYLIQEARTLLKAESGK